MTRTHPPTGTKPDPRSPTDRRQRDGLGLLPRAKTPEERRCRERLNRLLGWGMFGFGVFTWAGSLVSLWQLQDVAFVFSALLAVFVAVQGVRLVTWKDRRKGDRRTPKGDSRTA